VLVELDTMLDAVWSQGREPALIVMSEDRWWDFSLYMHATHRMTQEMGDGPPILEYAGCRIVVDCMSVGEMFVV
jgi:hypothetical protein